MAVTNEDLARLVVTLEATTTKYYNELRKAQQQTNSSATAIEKRLTTMSSRIDKTFANLGNRLSSSITGPLAGIGAAFSIREVIRYADAWTEAGNQIASASDISGIQARGLEDIRKLADEGRASFQDTIKLYARLQRSAGAVAESELDIARATNIVNKAFKAGGAATSEIQAGILQLSQGLSSGLLQGDELRSVRENAPILANVIADYFNVTIGGLKELGSQGKLTSDEVFKAILSGEKLVESAFGTTQRTISDGFTLVQNALIQYVGSADQSNGVTMALNAGLTALAENINVVGDVVLKLAALIAGALVGRSLVALTGGLLAASRAVVLLRGAFASAAAGGASMATLLRAIGVAAGPIATLLGGGALLAIQHFASATLDAQASVAETTKLFEELGLNSITTAKQIREQAAATEELTEAQRKLRDAERNRQTARINQSEDFLRFGDGGSRFTSRFTANADLTSAFTIAERAYQELNKAASETDRIAAQSIQRLAEGLRNSTIPAQEVIDSLREIQETPISQPILDLVDSLDAVAISLFEVEKVRVITLDDTEIKNANQAVIDLLVQLLELAKGPEDFETNQAIQDLIVRLEEGEIASADTLEELSKLTSHNGNFAAFLSNIGVAISEVIRLGVEAANTKALTDTLTRNRSVPSNGSVGQESSTDAKIRERIDAGKAFISQQDELLAKTKEERDILDEIARIRKDIPDGAIVNEGEIRRIAIANLAQKESDKASSSKTKTDAEKFLENLNEQERSNRQLQEEIELRSMLNPLINDYGFAIEQQTKRQELLNAAEDAGIALTPELENKINLIAEAYANAQVGLTKLEESQDKVRESMQEWFDLGKSVTRSFIDDLIEGKSAAEAFGNALSQIGSKLIDIGLTSLFGGGSGGNPLGLLGNLFGGFRERGGNVSSGQAYVVGEKRPELFVPNQNGVIIPRIPEGMGSGSGINTPININIDATGADSAGLSRVQAELVKFRAEVPYLIRNQVQNRSRKGW